jgi:hypothetical protein
MIKRLLETVDPLTVAFVSTGAAVTDAPQLMQKLAPTVSSFPHLSQKGNYCNITY